MSDLVITKLSHASAPALSRQEMILLCEKVPKEIEVYFYEEIDNEVVWQGTGYFTPSDVHKQVAICFKTPKYTRIPVLDRSVNVKIQLRRPLDDAVSEPLPFQFIPEPVIKHPRRPPAHMSGGSSSLTMLQPQQHPSMNTGTDYLSLMHSFSFESQIGLPPTSVLNSSNMNPLPSFSTFWNTREPPNLLPAYSSVPNELELGPPGESVSIRNAQETTVSSSGVYTPMETTDWNSWERLDSADLLQ